MSTILEIPKLPSSVVLDPPLTDEEFEKLCAANDFVQLERTKDGAIIVNAPTGGDSSSGNIEIGGQLRDWWKQHRQGRVFDSNAGFFLPDGSSCSPDAAYATAEQMRGLTKEDRKHFLRFTPAFVVELLSSSDSLPAAKKKMDLWLANGAELAWLIDPYLRNVLIYERGQATYREVVENVVGTGPVAGFVLDLASVWSLFED
ncbi:Uma2 family endonuclease [Silvibacterium bohemicum]|uniref:Uma2 family endonuclease n=1 Tax=Silvibacterium bohemicum TaxID=1577686 RepID=A0A841K4W7_9BACT|nr:Uma2 family endonuclease [Silvibacterium bohemicum]MBB6146989.1 Uma2 family endonuclease [Silvibacterium bohemicum]